MRWLYSFVLWCAIPLVFLWLLLRSRKQPAYRQRWKERMGCLPAPMCTSNKNLDACIWLHAASMGEVQAATPLIQALLAEFTNVRLVVTTMTPTGSEQVQRNFANALAVGSLQHCYVPLDTRGATRRFMRAIKPKLAIIIETELWPNLINAAVEQSANVVIASARLSEKSVQGYQKWPFAKLIKHALQQVDWVATQSHADAKRFQLLGLPADKSCTFGNLKFDFSVADGVRRRGQSWRQQFGRRPVWIAASTHAGEEAQVLEAHQRILTQYPATLLLLVPRHPERFAEVIELSEQVCVTQQRSSFEELATDTHVLVVDSMGELNDFYAASDVAFVGGTLVPVGGHNLLEPAALGVPVLFGPYTANCTAIAGDMLQRSAAEQVQSADGLAEQVLHWFTDTASARKAGQLGQSLVKQNRGALQNLLELIRPYLK